MEEEEEEGLGWVAEQLAEDTAAVGRLKLELKKHTVYEISQRMCRRVSVEPSAVVNWR